VDVIDLGTMEYRAAWSRQEQLHADVVAGADERILLVEHPPVITLGRRPGADVDLVESDRGGNITFHGPGQIVAYPIIRLNDHRLSVGGYVHRLEDVVIHTLRELGVESGKDACAVGVWAGGAKVAAIGVRVRRGVTLHGLALNVSTDRYFDLIVPCGLARRPVMSVHTLLPDNPPTVQQVKQMLARNLVAML
jgi:lipoyl(octanoyl) transferase